MGKRLAEAADGGRQPGPNPRAGLFCGAEPAQHRGREAGGRGVRVKNPRAAGLSVWRDRGCRDSASLPPAPGHGAAHAYTPHAQPCAPVIAARVPG